MIEFFAWTAAVLALAALAALEASVRRAERYEKALQRAYWLLGIVDQTARWSLREEIGEVLGVRRRQ